MTNGNTNALTELQAIAAEALAALDTCHQISPFSARLSAFDLDDAYRVTAAIRQMREKRGEMPVGRKIGFTNRTVWAEYGPIWGYVYNRTLHNLAEIGDMFSLVGLAEPRIEPEIIFKLALAPAPGMDEKALLACIDWVGHGFEIVQSIFPGWKFSAPDAVAAFGLHGALLIGPRHSIAAHAADWSRTLSTFEIDLKRDGGHKAFGHHNFLQPTVEIAWRLAGVQRVAPPVPGRERSGWPLIGGQNGSSKALFNDSRQ
jgi:2-oxo-3-hexenedioate decarboxylase